ncbi:TIGR01212 family radical SAM protein [Mycoplasmatota bacterium WC44]
MNLMNNEKRYNTLSNYYKYRFGSKVFKVSLNANFTCPNIKDNIGCTFCLEGSGEYAGNPNEPLKNQFNNVKEMMLKKWPEAKYIAYFQANTNTLDEINNLRKLYEEALTLDENIVGLSISTRPDSISLELMDYFKELSKKTYLTIELGLQSIYDETLNSINRGHTYSDFEECVKELRKRNINVIVHIINGLPNETKEMMLETTKKINTLDIQGVKVHLLHIMKNTQMGREYLNKPFKTLTQEEYTNIVCDQLEILNKEIIIHRLTGDAPKEQLIEPIWSLKKFVVINEIDKEMRRRDSYQGCLE